MSDALDQIFAALANPARRQMLRRLQEGPATVMELAAPSGLTQPTVSSHLKVLEKAGLVTRGREAQTRPVVLNAERLEKAWNWLGDYKAFWEVSLERLERYAQTLPDEETDP
ncbi:ArsR/SmtB family transcription factor [Pseudoroseicyclus sp. H15]